MPRFTVPIAIPLAALALSGCVQQIKESRVRAALMNAGVSDRGASCMAGRMVDRLNIKQLRKLEALSSIDRNTIGSMSIRDFVTRVERIQDPEVLAVVSTSGIVCALQG